MVGQLIVTEFIACLFCELQKETHKRTLIPHLPKPKGKSAQKHQVRNLFNHCVSLNNFIRLWETCVGKMFVLQNVLKTTYFT